jgi:hypothetical protein
MKIEGRFLPLPDDLIGSYAFPECPPAAVKILLAIGKDWLDRGCKDNGQLAVTYKMITLKTGINDKRIISLSLKQLAALGLLVMNNGNFNGRTPNRYRLPWLPGHNGGPPTKEYLEIKSREEAKRRLEGLKKKRKPSRKIRVTVEFEDL